MSIREYDDKFSVMDTDFKNSEILETLKGWKKENGEIVGEMDVYVEMEVGLEDNSFDYPGHGGGTQRQVDVVATVVKVQLIDDEGNILEDDIQELIKSETLEKWQDQIQESTTEADLTPEREYEPDDF